MHPCFQDIFVTSDDYRTLRYQGTRHKDRWRDGVLETPDGASYAAVQDGVPFFVPPEQDPWGDDETVDRLLAQYDVRRETLIATNWSGSVESWRRSGDRAWTERIVDHGGLILIIACGPGGSHAPYILDLDPQAQLLLNDIGRWVVVEWQRFAVKQGTWPCLGCAQFDARCFPLRADCLDAVDSSGALGEIGEASLVLQEAFRVLKPGGRLFLAEGGRLDPECLQQFPEEGLQELRDHGFLREGPGIRERLVSAGFQVTFFQRSGPAELSLGRSTLADIADKYGVRIRGWAVSIEAQKP